MWVCERKERERRQKEEASSGREGGSRVGLALSCFEAGRERARVSRQGGFSVHRPPSTSVPTRAPALMRPIPALKQQARSRTLLLRQTITYTHACLAVRLSAHLLVVAAAAAARLARSMPTSLQDQQGT